MGIKFAGRLSSSTGDCAESRFVLLGTCPITKFAIKADYDKPSARLSSNSAISSREFDLGEPAR